MWSAFFLDWVRKTRYGYPFISFAAVSLPTLSRQCVAYWPFSAAVRAVLYSNQGRIFGVMSGLPELRGFRARKWDVSSGLLVVWKLEGFTC